MKKKVQAITDCFINSSIPPELQIDVPIEMAEKLMERITSRNPNIGPYLFREVQVCFTYDIHFNPLTFTGVFPLCSPLGKIN